MDIGKYNNEITELPDISEDMYENIFKVYTIKEDKNSPYYFFNILNKIDFPESLDSSLY